MSDVSQGYGWWMASDGKWYPPHLHPDAAPGYGPPGYPPPAPAQPYAPNNGFAIASLVLGIVWIYAIGSILALIFGYKARREIDQSGGRQSGRGMATAGIVLGWIGVVCTALLFAVIVFFINSDTYDDFNSDPSNGYCNEDRFWQDPDC